VKNVRNAAEQQRGTRNGKVHAQTMEQKQTVKAHAPAVALELIIA
jgi:hypothetical protein